MKPFEQATPEELRALWEAQHGTPEIVPAEALTKPPGIEEKYYTINGVGNVISSRWCNDDVDLYRLKEKNVFPYTEEGKAGAELRAKVSPPGIHWQEDLKKLKQEMIEWGESDFHDQDALISFLDKYLPK